MNPLNFAILRYFTTVKEACADDVIEALKDKYGKFKALNKKSIIESLMTAKVNHLLEETRFDYDSKGEVRIYYRIHKEGVKIINKYINDE